jgi:microsomal dipeptidase-like Zn-dependent dipeptidase
MKWALYGLVACTAAVLGLFVLGRTFEGFMNRVEPVPLPEVSEHAKALHAASFVVDLHADSSLTGRNLLERSDIGHVDVPRLVEGGVALQFFNAPTKVPMSSDVHATGADGLDLISVMEFVQRGPFGLLTPFERGMLLGGRIRRTVELSDGQVVLIRTRRDLASLLESRAANKNQIGALLGLEGAHALENPETDLARFYEAGVRLIGLTHFFDNEYAGSAHGLAKGGLTQLGRELVAGMVERGMMIDLAHLSPAAIDDVLAMVKVPTVVSHTGVKGTCDNPRNLSDRHVRAIAEGGGVIGVGFWAMAVCGTAPEKIVAAMLHIVDLVGDEHVSLGSDYDGSTTVAFDISKLPSLTQAMIDAKLSDASITKILGGNILRVMQQVLPEG